jgi:hypothetical protein
MQQISGVGPVTSLCFALVVDDPERFKKRRSVGAYMGLVPDLEDSGEVESELGISKARDEMCRRYLVQAAQYFVGPFGPDTDLRRWGAGDDRAGEEQESEETGGNRCGTQALGLDAAALGDRGPLRAAVQRGAAQGCLTEQR